MLYVHADESKYPTNENRDALKNVILRCKDALQRAGVLSSGALGHSGMALVH
jgi:hypothetical protein